MILKLTKDESKTFYEIINSELKCVINEWDNDLGRCPSKKRIKDGQYAKTIIDKWTRTQKYMPGTKLINLDNIDACNLNLSDKEIKYSKNLLNIAAKECYKILADYPAPYTGVLLEFDKIATCAKNINAKL